MGRIAVRSKMTAEEYLAWEQDQPTKHEFFDGEVYAMAGASQRHNVLCMYVGTALTNALRPRGCIVHTSDQRVRIWSRPRYVYPDITVVCGKSEIEKYDVLTNPTMIVEVLSKSTEQDDRDRKWDSYQRIPSLTDYVLVSQAKPRIEHFQRASDGSWTYRAAGPGERVTLSTGTDLIVDDIFAGTFDLQGDAAVELPDLPD